MNLEQVAHFIAHPQELGPGEAAALKELSEKHRYASVFSLLYLTALANGKSVDLDAALQQHAYRLSDRTKLYHLLNDSAATAGAEVTERTEKPSAPEELQTPQVVAIHEEPRTAPAESESEAATAESSAPEWQPATEQTDEAPVAYPAEEEFSGKEEEASIGEPDVTAEEPATPGEETAEAPQATEPDDVPFTFDRVTEAFTREQHFDIVFDPDTPAETPAASEEDASLSDAATAEPNAVAEEQPQEAETDTAPANETVRSGDEGSASTEKTAAAETPPARPFTSWLKSGSGEQAVTATAEKTPEIQPEEKPLKKVDAIIENFIKEEPSITRNRAEFFSPSKKAKESLDEEAVPVSETLAKIYAAQGNYPKAIHVYHQLMLSFPEKKSLFAVQIETLKKKITS